MAHVHVAAYNFIPRLLCPLLLSQVHLVLCLLMWWCDVHVHVCHPYTCLCDMWACSDLWVAGDTCLELWKREIRLAGVCSTVQNTMNSFNSYPITRERFSLAWAPSTDVDYNHSKSHEQLDGFLRLSRWDECWSEGAFHLAPTCVHMYVHACIPLHVQCM